MLVLGPLLEAHIATAGTENGNEGEDSAVAQVTAGRCRCRLNPC